MMMEDINQLLIERLQDDEFTRRELALRKAESLRHRMQERLGRPLQVDIHHDLEHIREKRDERIANSGR